MKSITQANTKESSLVSRELRARVPALYQQGKDVETIADFLSLEPETVQAVLDEAERHSRIVYVYADGPLPATVIDVRNLTRKIEITNLTEELTSRAFGVKETPGWEDYEYFLESRCMPRSRYGIREELRDLGLDFYDPFVIVQKTRGRVYGDRQYLSRMSGEWILGYDEILKNTKEGSERTEKLKEYLRKSEGAWKLDEGQYGRKVPDENTGGQDIL
ncbi:MAG: hypothetical protein K1W28_08290 [Lachnospiraceae bacterium]